MERQDSHRPEPLIRTWITALAVVLGIVLTVYCYYPGYMSNDSFDQWMQGRTGTFNDAHPPLMSYVWGLLDRVVPGPAGMLVFHNVLFWSGIGILVSDLFGLGYLASLLILMIGFFPPIFALLGTIWKDVGMGAALVLATAMYSRAQEFARTNRLKSNLFSAAGLLSAFYALSVRHNALPAVLPLVIWNAWTFMRANTLGFSAKKQFASAAAIGISVLLMMEVSVLRINASLTKDNRTHPSQIILIHDLVAISIDTNQVLLPAFVNDGGAAITVTDLKNIYSPLTTDPMFFGDSRVRRLQFHNDDRDFKILLEQWVHVVPHHLHPYLVHRWVMLKAMMGIGMKEVWYPYQRGIDPNPYGLKVRNIRFNHSVMSKLEGVKNSTLFRVWFYLLLIPMAITIMLVRARTLLLPASALGLSAALNSLHYFFLGVTPDFRYNWWTVCATVLMITIILAGMVSRRAIKQPDLARKLSQNAASPEYWGAPASGRLRAIQTEETNGRFKR